MLTNVEHVLKIISSSTGGDLDVILQSMKKIPFSPWHFYSMRSKLRVFALNSLHPSIRQEVLHEYGHGNSISVQSGGHLDENNEGEIERSNDSRRMKTNQPNDGDNLTGDSTANESNRNVKRGSSTCGIETKYNKNTEKERKKEREKTNETLPEEGNEKKSNMKSKEVEESINNESHANRKTIKDQVKKRINSKREKIVRGKEGKEEVEDITVEKLKMKPNPQNSFPYRHQNILHEAKSFLDEQAFF
jgi:hypothetical protein